jgi:hypothetical protein
MACRHQPLGDALGPGRPDSGPRRLEGSPGLGKRFGQISPPLLDELFVDGHRLLKKGRGLIALVQSHVDVAELQARGSEQLEEPGLAFMDHRLEKINRLP